MLSSSELDGAENTSARRKTDQRPKARRDPHETGTELKRTEAVRTGRKGLSDRLFCGSVLQYVCWSSALLCFGLDCGLLSGWRRGL